MSPPRDAPPPYDWSGNPLAQRNRAEKIDRIVAWCQENGYDPEVAEPKTRRWITRQALAARVQPSTGRRSYPTASDETWQGVVTKFRQERDAGWLERALAADDTPAARILAAAAERRAGHHVEDTSGPSPAR